MTVHSLDIILHEHPFLEGLEPGFLELLTGCAKNVRYPPGAYLWREDEPADSFFLLREGQVALSFYVPHKGELCIETLSAGEVLGWSWMIRPYKWHFDARALTEVRAIEVDARCLREKAIKDKSFGYEMLVRFAAIMQERLESTRLRLLDLYSK